MLAKEPSLCEHQGSEEGKPMTSIQIDDQVAKALANWAERRGVSINHLLREMIVVMQAQNSVASEEFDRDLDDIIFFGPSLPVDFGRADIYGEHD
jgi:hypothetical protein